MQLSAVGAGESGDTTPGRPFGDRNENYEYDPRRHGR